MLWRIRIRELQAECLGEQNVDLAIGPVVCWQIL